ncbi:ABC transporter permease subunit [Neptunicella sp. SCSIO 80796]|uniref:ABC transporter permease subunit n=1 Tax=Neptunicella plasticusilytica TaxID=3117012 RepID=UPI003A4E3706
MDIRRCWMIAAFELNRLFMTRRGLIALAAFALFWFVIFYYLISRGAEILNSPAFADMAKQTFGQLGLSEIYQWPMAELAIYWLIAIYLYPAMTVMMSADQTASDRDRGTLRFLVLRSTRSEILLGRFIGQVLIMALLSGISLLAALVMGSMQNAAVIVVTGVIALGLWGHLLLALLPFIALMTLFNGFLRSARQSVLVASLALGGLSILLSLLSYWYPSLSILEYVLPGNDLTDLLSLPGQSLQSYLQPGLQTIGLLLLAWMINQRSAL